MTTSSTPRRSRWRADLVWAFGWTLWTATFFAAFVLVQSVARGSFWYAEYQLSTWAIIAGYYLAATLAAVALAILRPLGKNRFGSYVLGVVIGFLVYSSVGMIADGFKAQTFIIGGIAGVLVGGLGLVAHDQGAPTWQGSDTLSMRKMVGYGIALLISLVLLWLDIRND